MSGRFSGHNYLPVFLSIPGYTSIHFDVLLIILKSTTDQPEDLHSNTLLVPLFGGKWVRNIVPGSSNSLPDLCLMYNKKIRKRLRLVTQNGPICSGKHSAM